MMFVQKLTKTKMNKTGLVNKSMMMTMNQKCKLRIKITIMINLMMLQMMLMKKNDKMMKITLKTLKKKKKRLKTKTCAIKSKKKMTDKNIVKMESTSQEITNQTVMKKVLTLHDPSPYL